MDNLKNINIGKMIQTKFHELNIPLERACNFFNCNEQEIENMFMKSRIETDLLLKWSKLLEYDFFRLYSHHLILYSPPSPNKIQKNSAETKLPEFRKNVYTKEVIDYIIKQIENKIKTPNQVMNEYRIPKTTLYRWLQKYNTKPIK